MQAITEVPGDLVRIRVRLIPRASRAEVVGWLESGELKIRVTSAPVEEAANLELIRFLAKTLGIKKADITITGGAHSRVKHLEVPVLCKNRLLSFDNIC
jgi:uncharacterized protein (TIGR00251 family)